MKSTGEAAPEKGSKEKEALASDKKSLDGYYDLLIKVGDNPLSGGYKDGDIVMVKPAGYLWSAKEREKFLIVRARLTPERALELMKPGETVTIVDKESRKATKILKRRNHRFNLHKMTLQERVRAARGRLTGQPLEVSDLEKMTEKK